MKRVPCSLVVWLLLLAMIALSHEVLAGNCGPAGCPFPAPAVQQQPAPIAAPSKHGFTATGGSRVADINLSQEAREVIMAEGKETPLPKGFLSAADRAKLIAKQSPLYGWPTEETRRRVSSAQSQNLVTTRVAGDSRTKGVRSTAEAVKKGTTAKVTIAAKAKSQN